MPMSHNKGKTTFYCPWLPLLMAVRMHEVEARLWVGLLATYHLVCLITRLQRKLGQSASLKTVP